ncbi:gluconate 2-dehydrogenase subunit 3 family protein [Halorarius litoreus]|uniref:gluconate 2-dehydrogenase subunit 3 family protein n=1 Tax=Halorarius litoreus TaxID=2962676 RepID=UPI0020CBF784|nr:gluconate 2-dehydrogenase subunit 3 family protein [Halorarius litoreus]
MKLTRRDAIAALAGVGIVTGSGAAAFSRSALESATDAESDLPSIEATLDTLVATAEVVYPSAVDGVSTFVETYALGRLDDRPAHLRSVREAVDELDTHADLWFGADEFASLSATDRDDLLHEMGVHTAEAQPDGTIAERVRYFVVNDLLYALYSSPAGGTLVGLENPPGHPGGTESYQRGPR